MNLEQFISEVIGCYPGQSDQIVANAEDIQWVFLRTFFDVDGSRTTVTWQASEVFPWKVLTKDGVGNGDTLSEAINRKWSNAPIYFGGDGTPQLIFIGNSPVAYFTKKGGTYGKPTIYVSQNMNREEFMANLLANLPSFCEEYGITGETITDIFTRSGLERYATIRDINIRSRLTLKKE